MQSGSPPAASGKLDLAGKDFDAEACLNEPDASVVRIPYPHITDVHGIRRCANLVPASVREEAQQEHGGLAPKVQPPATLHCNPCIAQCRIRPAPIRALKITGPRAGYKVYSACKRVRMPASMTSISRFCWVCISQ